MNTKHFLSRINSIFLVAILILILVSYVWRVSLLNDAFNYDEGIHLIWGKLWVAGYTPYEEIFVSYPPFFLWSLGLPWQLFHQAGALQLFMATYALTGVLAVIYLGAAYGGRLAGLAAGIFLSFAPAYFIPSTEVMGEVPSVGLAVVAIALAETDRVLSPPGVLRSNRTSAVTTTSTVVASTRLTVTSTDPGIKPLREAPLAASMRQPTAPARSATSWYSPVRLKCCWSRARVATSLATSDARLAALRSAMYDTEAFSVMAPSASTMTMPAGISSRALPVWSVLRRDDRP